MDIETGEWYSLCEQQVAIRRDTSSPREELRFGEEGFVSGGTTGEATVVNFDQSITHVSRGSDVIFRWTGWGVTSPPPFSTRISDNVRASGGLGLRANHLIKPHSQYQQRVGKHHRFRARLVDVAGNSWTCKEADEILAANKSRYFFKLLSPSIVVQRFRPSKVPVILRKSEKELAEVRVLVIRSYDKESSKPSEYLAFAPRIGFELMQLLGTTDGAANEAEALRILRKAHSRSLTAEPAAVQKNNLPPKGKLWSKHLTIEDPDVRGIAWWFLPGYERPTTSEEISEAGITLRSDDSTLTATSPLIASYPHTRLPSGKKHAVGPVRIILDSGRKRASKIHHQYLHITLPPGESQQVVVSSALHITSLPHYGLFTAATRTPSITAGSLPSRSNRLLQNAANGASAMLTPNMVIHLVHASQRPVTVPILYSQASPVGTSTDSSTIPVVRRNYGDPNVSIDFTYFAHSPSTGRIDIEAQWIELEDRPGIVRGSG